MSTLRREATQARGALMVVFLLLAALAAPAALHGQVALFPVQNLSFGQMRPGAAELVDVGDAVRRGELELVGDGHVVITLGLPTEMVSIDGHRLPLSFSNGDATVEMRTSGKTQSFDPGRPKNLNIHRKEGGARLYLGGMALPDAAQPAGSYTATITVQVVAAGT